MVDFAQFLSKTPIAKNGTQLEAYAHSARPGSSSIIMEDANKSTRSARHQTPIPVPVSPVTQDTSSPGPTAWLVGQATVTSAAKPTQTESVPSATVVIS